MFGFFKRGKKSGQEPVRGSNGSKYWALATLCIVVVLVVGILIYRGMDKIADVTNNTVQSAGDSFRPKVTIETIIFNAIGEVRKESKLVVMSVDLDVTLEKRSTKKVIWDLLNLGTTTVAFKALENRVQYVIPTEQFSEKAVTWDAGKKILTINLVRILK